jgi:protease-4
MIRRSLVAMSLAAALTPPAAAAPSLSPDALLYGHQSAAFADDAGSLLFNPAAAAIRYPSELALTLLDSRPGTDAYRGALVAHGLTLSAAGTAHGASTLGMSLAGGADRLRLGSATDWIGGAGRGRIADTRLGLLSRPQPWLSIGGVVEHATEPEIDGVRRVRDYTLGLALRPFALSPRRAHDRGPRWTLTADARLREDDHFAHTEFRVGGELEIVRGVALQGLYFAQDRGFQLGVSLLGVNAGYHAQSGFDRDGTARYVTHSLSFHAAEDRTALATRARARVAVVRVGGALGDDDLGGLTLFGPVGSTAVAPLHRQLEAALEDPLTRGVLLDLRGAANMAQIEELRARVKRLRDAGKPVVAYLEEGGGRGDFYLASACDRVVATPQAFFPGLGLRAERRYYRGFLADLGVRIDRTSYGKYKSAFRNFSVDSTPPADREAIEHSLDVVQDEFVNAVSADRGIGRERLLGVLDGRRWTSAELQTAGLLDSVGYREDALRMLGRQAGLGARPHTVRLARREAARRDWTTPSPIAVVYASGAIETGRSGSDLLMGPTMGSETMTRQIERAFRNPSVRAVVLRVESPGGSSVGSDLIEHALERMKRETGKPLVVSMGGAAASGGYNISVPGDRIYADRFTATGSIGVLLVKPSFEGWYAKHEVRQETFERGPYMRGWSSARDWDPEIQAAADSAVYAEYKDFVTTVADARRLPWDEVERSAQGRVWFGKDALERKLVDGIGGLEDAIAEGRRLADVPEGQKIRIVEYRRPQAPLLQRLAGSLVSETWQSTVRWPAPGELLYWTDEEILP